MVIVNCKANDCYTSVCSCQDYCSYHRSCLSKLQECKSIPNIQEIETFTTWFNGNCGYVINYDYSASSFLPLSYLDSGLRASRKKHEWKFICH